MNSNERILYPIHNDDLQRFGLPKADEQIGGDGLEFTPWEIKRARERFEKSEHENLMNHRDLSQAVAIMIAANKQWDITYKQLDGDYVELKKESENNYQLYKQGVESERTLLEQIQNKDTELDKRSASIDDLKNTLAVKDTARAAQETKIQNQANTLAEQMAMVSYYEKRYGVFEPGYYESGTVRDLTRFQRFIGRLFRILLPPPEKRLK